MKRMNWLWLAALAGIGLGCTRAPLAVTAREGALCVAFYAGCPIGYTDLFDDRCGEDGGIRRWCVPTDGG
jgi:hypothetical protein